MNKKNLILFSTALLLIPSCLVIGNKITAKKRLNDLKTVVETDEDNEGLFNEAKLLGFDVVADRGVTYNAASEGWIEPQVGLQYTNNGETAAVRFIGAIKVLDKNDNGSIDEEDYEDLNIRWTRNMYAPDGTQVKSTADKESTKLYRALNANGQRYTVEQYNADNGTNFTHFVTYVMKGIPVDTHGNDYITAALYVDSETPSKVYATKIKDQTRFAFDASYDTASGTYFASNVSNKLDATTTSVAKIESDNYLLKHDLVIPAGEEADFLFFSKQYSAGNQLMGPTNKLIVYDYDYYNANSEIAVTKGSDSSLFHIDTNDISNYEGFVSVYKCNDGSIMTRLDDSLVRHYSFNLTGVGTLLDPKVARSYYIRAIVTDADGVQESYFYNTKNWEAYVRLPKGITALEVAVCTSTSIPYVPGDPLTGMDYTSAYYSFHAPSLFESMNGDKGYCDWQTDID